MESCRFIGSFLLFHPQRVNNFSTFTGSEQRLMKISKFGYFLQITVVVTIILVAGGHQLPKYVSRLTFLAVLAAVDMLYWFSVKKSFTPRFKKVLTVAYWMPMWLLLLFFISGFIAPHVEWPSFIRIYLPGILLVLLIGKGIFLFLLIASDVFIIPLNAIRRIDPESSGKTGGWYRPRSFLLTGASISSLVMLTFFAGMIFWVTNFKSNTIEIPVKDLPAAFDGYRIVQISDLHLGTFLTTKPLQKLVNIIAGLQPDLIVFTGDMVNFTTDEVYPFEENLKKLSARDGIYTILGNHDYGEYTSWESQAAKDLNDQALFMFYQRIGWHLLRNQNAIIKRDSASIAILGVENWSSIKRFGKKGDLKKALLGTTENQYKILLSHDPTHWDSEINTEYQQIGLTLSGHTHAFQMSIETGSVKWSPASILFKEWAGLYEKVHVNGVKQYLYVNRGAGTLGYPGRIGGRPEITLLILRKAN